MKRIGQMRLGLVIAATLIVITAAYTANGFLHTLSLHTASAAASSTEAEGPALLVAHGLSVNAGDAITVPIRFQSGEQEVAGIGLSLDFDQACLAFDDADENGSGVPDAITFDVSPQFFPSVSFDLNDADGEIDLIIADYSPPLASLGDSEQLIRVRFTAVCQPVNATGDVTRIEFSSEPAVSFSSPNGQPVRGSATGASLLILPQPAQPDFTPQPTPTATFTATPMPSPTSTPVPVPGNRPPSVGNDTATTNEDTSVTIDVLRNDSDPDGDELSVNLAAPPTHGQVTVNADKTMSYLPHADFNGNDSFTYTASDGRGAALLANVNITVRAVNDPPVILVVPSDQTNQTGEVIALVISVNDVDTAQSDLSLTAEGLPSGITLNSEVSQIEGMIDEGAAGTYTVFITVSDGSQRDRVQFQWIITESALAFPVYLPHIQR